MQKATSAVFIGLSLIFLLITGCASDTPEEPSAPIATQPPLPTATIEEVIQSPTEDSSDALIVDEPIEPVGEEPIVDLIETYWNLIQLDGTDMSDQGMTLNLRDYNAISGSDGCNSFQGSYISEGNQFTLDGPIISTMIACADMTLSNQYSTALLATSKGYISGNQLILETEFGNLIFEPAVFAQLENTKWTLNSLSDGEAVVSMAIDQNIYFTIEGNTINGSGGCNSFGGNVETNEKQIRFGDVFSTEMYCEADGVSMREGEFLTALNQVASYSILRDTLTLFDETNAIIAVFTQS